MLHATETLGHKVAHSKFRVTVRVMISVGIGLVLYIVIFWHE